MQKLITNEGTSPMYHGNTMIPPGESRLVEVPGVAATQAEPAGPSLSELLTALLAKAIAAIDPELPGLTNEALELALEMEKAGKNRTTLIAAIEAEGLRRADERLRAEEDERARVALETARGELLTARVALDNLAADASEADRSAAVSLVEELEAKVAALAPAQE